MSEDDTVPGASDSNDSQDDSSRPATAAARRGRRGAANRPAGRADAKRSRDAKDADTKDRKGRPTPTATKGDERPSPIARFARFLREVVAELRKVIWPTRKELVTYTGVVLVFLVFMVTVIALLDIAFAKGVFWLFG